MNKVSSIASGAMERLTKQSHSHTIHRFSIIVKPRKLRRKIKKQKLIHGTIVTGAMLHVAKNVTARDHMAISISSVDITLECTFSRTPPLPFFNVQSYCFELLSRQLSTDNLVRAAQLHWSIRDSLGCRPTSDD